MQIYHLKGFTNSNTYVKLYRINPDQAYIPHHHILKYLHWILYIYG